MDHGKEAKFKQEQFLFITDKGLQSLRLFRCSDLLVFLKKMPLYHLVGEQTFHFNQFILCKQQ